MRIDSPKRIKYGKLIATVNIKHTCCVISIEELKSTFICEFGLFCTPYNSQSSNANFETAEVLLYRKIRSGLQLFHAFYYNVLK